MGCDKAFLEFGDPPLPLWRRQLRLLESLGAQQLLLSHNADQTFGALPQETLGVVDFLRDRGPLGGLISCLRHNDCDRLLVLAVDLPFVTREFLLSLLDEGGGVVLQSEGGGRFEAVVAVYTPDCLEIAEDHLRRGELAMQPLIAACIAAGHLQARPLAATDRELLRNLNRPEDL
jgi:molybdopterin-guanine dinucleotide biosynthesis protein A